MIKESSRVSAGRHKGGEKQNSGEKTKDQKRNRRKSSIICKSGWGTKIICIAYTKVHTMHILDSAQSSVLPTTQNRDFPVSHGG